jgi:hypothetical protein
MMGIDQLWGGVIHSFVVDLLAPAIIVVVQVNEAGVVRSYRLTLGGLREFRLVREPGIDWDYAELTSIEASREGAGWRVLVELWSSQSTVNVLCGWLSLEATETPAEPERCT